jgi:PKD repeat protein
VAIALSFAVAPASAVVAKIAGHAYGLTPVEGVSATSLPGTHKASPSGVRGTSGVRSFDSAGQLVSHGGPVMHSVTTHLVYWDPSKEFVAATKSIIGKFFSDVAHDSGLASNVFGVAGQYTDGTGNAAYSSKFGGELSDTAPYPTTGNCTIPKGADEGPPYTKCLTDAQVTEQLSSFIAKNKLPTGPAQQYFMLFPHKVVTCFPEEGGKHPCSNNAFCAYHGVLNEGTPEEIIYSNIPTSLLDKAFAKGCQADGWEKIQEPNSDATGLADVALKYISHEYIEAATDPQLNNWFDASGHEIGDKCNSWSETAGVETDPNAFEPTLGGEQSKGTLFDQSINADHYYIQSEWDNGAAACSMMPVPLEGVGFTLSPATSIVGSPINFSGVATDDYGGLGFTWSFGDGGSASGASPSHTFAAPGSYKVTMTATDSLTGATAAPVEHTLVINDVPTASFTVAPNPGVAGSPEAFNGGASIDPDGFIASYAWSFGDGATGSGASPSHAYATAGSYTVTLTVTDSAGQTAAASQSVTVHAPPAQIAAATPITPVAAPPNDQFSSLSATVDPNTGAVTFTESVGNAGTFSWLLTFQNGRFGAFASSNTACKPGFLRLKGKCRPARVVFAKGSKAAASAGSVSFTIKPTSSGLKALRSAFRQKKGLPVLAVLSFQSSLGGAPVSHTQALLVKLKRA